MVAVVVDGGDDADDTDDDHQHQQQQHHYHHHHHHHHHLYIIVFALAHSACHQLDLQIVDDSMKFGAFKVECLAYRGSGKKKGECVQSSM